MSKRKKMQWDSFKDKVSKKRVGKNNDDSGHGLEYLTVQRLSSTVEGKCQKYSRIGPLTMVPLGIDPTLHNIKEACKNHFQATDMECDLLAGERGPSYTDTSQIKNWKLLHIRFIESSTTGASGTAPRFKIPSDKAQVSISVTSCKSEQKILTNTPIPSKIPASVPLSEMLKLGRLIKPQKDVVSIEVEEFSIEEKSWLDPFKVRLSLSKDKFASGAVRDAHEATAMSGLKPGRYVVKRLKQDQVSSIENLFTSAEIHTRKVVQMNTLARNFAKSLEMEIPREFGDTFTYTKVYFAKLNGEFVTVENYLDGTFCKYINNTGDIILNDGSEVVLKAETFVHYTYVKSGKQLMVLDIQGINYCLCDPEIATTDLVDATDQTILFCSGNLSSIAIVNFMERHKCNKYCDLLELDEK